MEDFIKFFPVILNIVTLCLVVATWFLLWQGRREEADAARLRQDCQDALKRFEDAIERSKKNS